MLKSWLGRLLRAQPEFPPLAPEEAFVAIGDIHGRYDLLKRMLSRLEGEPRIICVGDYVDRGDDSAAVLATLRERQDIICLKGNHEEMLSGFLADPDRVGARWLRYGGLQTLASYGVNGVTETASGAQLREASEALRAAMGKEMVGWLIDLPDSWRSGNVLVTHAGADPKLPPDQQPVEVLHWGHPDLATRRREDGVWVLYGHKIVQQPIAEKGRIAIDTGAYATGRLTAAKVSANGVEFILA